MSSAKVVVIGTGPSGTAAATKLLELGFEKVYVVEAENRIGGRINTVPFGDNEIDLGAQWCHGEKGNVVYELANPHNLLEPSGGVLDLFKVICSDGKKLPDKTEELLKGIVEVIRDSHRQELVGYDGSYGAYVTNKFFEELKKPEYSEIDMATAKAFLDVYKKAESSVISCDTLEDASANGILEYEECEGDQNLTWREKGYKSLLRLLMKSDEKGTELGVLDQRVMLGKRVKKIVWNGDQVKLICDDNDEILADHVICTVSLGVLKEKYASLFEPELPSEKVRAIQGLGYGTIDKLVLEFPTQFWADDWQGFTLLWREEDLKEIRGTKLAWLEDLFSFDFFKYKPRLLFGWIGGPKARQMEQLSDEEVMNGCLYLLKRFLNRDIPTPVKFIRSNWYTNENFRGVYSFRTALTEELKTGAADLAKPLVNGEGKPVVLFAGEATNKTHFSTVHGAVESGWREAERLAKFYEGAKRKQG